MKVIIRVDAEDCGISPRDVYENKETCEALENRIAHGEMWAWCDVIVSARVEHLGHVFMSQDTLGTCSYRDEEDFVKNSGYYEDMVKAAIQNLRESLDATIARGAAAKEVKEMDWEKIEVEKEG